MAEHNQELTCGYCKMKVQVQGLRGAEDNPRQSASLKHGIGGNSHKVVIVQREKGNSIGAEKA